MKKVNLFFIAMLISSIAFSQWNSAGNPNNRFGETNFAFWGNNNIRSIGIGHKLAFGGFIPGWSAQNPPRAALHINAHFLDAPPSWVFTPGQVFRTDGPSSNDNMWQLFTGANYSSATEKGRFYVPKKSNDFYVQASLGSLYFNTNGNNTQMKLDTKGFLTINTLATGNNTLIIADKNGTLVPSDIENTIAQSNTISELKKQITELQTQVKQLLLLAKKY